MKNNGKEFEILTKIFFSNLFNKLGFVLNKERIQFNGTQDGFDVQFIISQDYIERKIFIECKDYSKDVNFGNIYVKAHDLEASYGFTERDIAFFISPRASFGNTRNTEKSEPVFNNGKFRFNIRLFDKGNGIDKLFATDKNIYKEIYKKECLINVNKQLEYEKFKSILFSRAPLKKVLINERDKQNYIINIEKKRNYIFRTISPPNISKAERNAQLYYNYKKKSFNLIKAVNELFIDDKKDGIVLLGNPGTGKSIELQHIAIYFWENRINYNWIPFYRPVNSFISTSDITDYLPKEWKNIPYLIIILDGLDEISFSLEFKAKLDKFLIENSNTKIKFILSCRTNIYENVIKDIADFKCFVLDDLRYHQSLEYLEIKYNLSFDDFAELSFNNIQKEFLESPYYLDLFGQFYIETNTLPSNKVELIEKYVEKRLEDDRLIKYKNKTYDKSQVKLLCKKVALSLEAMQKTKIEDSRLNLLLKKDKSIFTNSCFVEKVFNEEMWEFEHKNIQEYFVASTLNDLSVKEVIEFIKLGGKHNKTHPSWLNSISHLINLMESKKLTILVDWLVENDPEVLFNADKNRISNKIKAKVFQNYFNKRCIEDTLWIRAYDKGIKEISKFAECVENINYLIKELKDKKNHRRTRISSLDLLSNMDLGSKKDEIQTIVIDLIKAPIDEVDFSFKSDAIDFIKNLKLLKNNNVLIDEIIKHLGDLDHLEVTNSVLKLIREVDCNYYFDYIKQTAPKVLDNSKRKYQRDGNLVTGERDTLKEILKKLNTFEGCIFEMNLRFDNEYNLKTEKEDIKNIVSRIIRLFQKNSDTIYESMIDFVLREIKFDIDYEDIIASFFTQTDTASEAFYRLYNSKISFDEKISFLIHLVTSKEIKFLIQEFKKDEIDKKGVCYFRNNLSYINHDLSMDFQKLVMDETGFNFDNKLLKKDERKKWKDFNETKNQREFDLIFDTNKLKALTNEYFTRFENEEFTRDNQLDSRKKYYQSIELQSKFPQTFIDLIHSSFPYNTKTVTKKNVIQTVESEFYLIYTIKGIIENNKNLKIKDTQINYIKKWCFKNISKANFRESLNYKKRNNYMLCSLLYCFRNKFNFTYPNETLLDMLYSNYNSEFIFDKNKSAYDYIIKQVGKEKVNQRVLLNFETGISNELIFKHHSFVAIENGLDSVYDKITDFISSDGENYSIKVSLLEKYIEKTNDIHLLKKLVKLKFKTDYSDTLAWVSIKLLIERNETNFIIEKLLESIKLNISEINKLELIRFLMRCNYEYSFKLFVKWINSNMSIYNRELNYSITSDDWVKHTNPKSIPYLIELVQIGSNPNVKFQGFSNPIRIAVETLKSITQNNNSDICLQVINLLEKCKDAPKNNNIDKFYFSSIINDTWKDYYNYISKPISFSKIAKKINKNRYTII